MNPECERHQLAIFEGRATGDDAEHCHDCRSLFELERTLAGILSTGVADAPEGLVSGTLAGITSRLERQWSERRRITRGLILAATFSLPLILIINAALIAIVYTLLTRLLPNLAALTATCFVAASLLMGVFLAYATLPLFASFGFRLRESYR